MKERIDELLIRQKKYRDGDYSQRKLAEELGISPFVLSRTLRQAYGMTYAQLVHKYRIRDAMRYLKSAKKQEYTIDDIGLLVGFGNRQSFYTAFKQETGMTPERFRTFLLEQNKA
jgi:AraC-like DNA-binding protein